MSGKIFAGRSKEERQVIAYTVYKKYNYSMKPLIAKVSQETRSPLPKLLKILAIHHAVCSYTLMRYNKRELHFTKIHLFITSTLQLSEQNEAKKKVLPLHCTVTCTVGDE